mgnify:CR=1 FL=1
MEGDMMLKIIRRLWPWRHRYPPYVAGPVILFDEKDSITIDKHQYGMFPLDALIVYPGVGSDGPKAPV